MKRTCWMSLLSLTHWTNQVLQQLHHLRPRRRGRCRQQMQDLGGVAVTTSTLVLVVALDMALHCYWAGSATAPHQVFAHVDEVKNVPSDCLTSTGQAYWVNLRWDNQACFACLVHWDAVMVGHSLGPYLGRALHQDVCVHLGYFAALRRPHYSAAKRGDRPQLLSVIQP